MVPKLSKGGGKWEEGQQRPSCQHGMGTPVPSHWGSQSTGPKNMEVLRGTKVSVVPDFVEELEYCVLQNVFWRWLSSRGLTPPAGHLLLSIPRFLSPQAWLTHHSPLQVTDLGSTRHRRFGKKTHPAKPPKM